MKKRVFIFMGLPGSGKSTLSTKITERFNLPRISTDIIRKQLFEDFDYNDKNKQMVYSIMHLIANNIFQYSNHDSLILDGTYVNENFRETLEKSAKINDYDIKYVVISCPVEICRERVKNRIIKHDSEITPEIFEEEFDTIKFPTEAIIIDNTKTIEEVIIDIQKALEL